MTKQEKLKHCEGCKQDFYNGKNFFGIRDCWKLDSAKLVLRKMVHINQKPPWKQKPIKVLNCYRQIRFVFLAPDREH